LPNFEKSQILNKPDQEAMLKFINGLPEKLAFYVRSSKPEDIAEAISLAKAGEAYTYRSDLKRQMGE
jgi:hypothetical protein